MPQTNNSAVLAVINQLGYPAEDLSLAQAQAVLSQTRAAGLSETSPVTTASDSNMPEGFSATLFQSNETGKKFLAFRGTELFDFSTATQDIQTDIGFALGVDDYE